MLTLRNILHCNAWAKSRIACTCICIYIYMYCIILDIYIYTQHILYYYLYMYKYLQIKFEEFSEDQLVQTFGQSHSFSFCPARSREATDSYGQRLSALSRPRLLSILSVSWRSIDPSVRDWIARLLGKLWYAVKLVPE
jgi:hypothetical protein